MIGTLLHSKLAGFEMFLHGQTIENMKQRNNYIEQTSSRTDSTNTIIGKIPKKSQA